MNAWKLQLGWALAAAVGCGGSTPPGTGRTAPQNVAPIAVVPVSLTLQQRSTSVVPGTQEKLSVTIDDITRGQVMVTLLNEQQQALAGPVSLQQGESMEFALAERNYTLELEQLDNALIGEDFATMVIFDPAAGHLTEQQKIERLIATVESLSGASFVRNGREHTPQEAAEHLREKVAMAGTSLATAEQFIEHVASRSSVTGTPYTIRLADGTEQPAGDFLRKQLAEIEAEGARTTSAAPEAPRP